MHLKTVQFDAPRSISVLKSDIPEPAENQVLVQTICSGISPGTEMLVYRGLWPENVPIDESISALSGKFQYPIKYGYSCVGRVVAIGDEVDPEWQNSLVFSFFPHQSHFIAQTDTLIPLPENVSPEQAAFLPNMETAVSFILDAKPLLGERVLVVGQGIVGLLTTALLSRFPLDRLITIDGYATRRTKALELGAQHSLAPDHVSEAVMSELFGGRGKADLTLEVSGNPIALNTAIQYTGYNGRILIGSWYGGKHAPIELGGYFHRSRITIQSSQVSRISPELTGCWTKNRRLNLAIKMLAELKPDSLVSHTFPVDDAHAAYKLIDEYPDKTIQVLLTY